MQRAATTAFVLLGSLLVPAAANAQPGPGPSWIDGSLSLATWRENRRTAPGWVASFGIYPTAHFGVVGETGEFRRVPLGYGMGGVRVRSRFANATPFVQFLVGRAPYDEGLALAPGGGVDWHVSRNLAARFGVGVKIAGDDGLTYVAPSFSVGLVFSVP
jgi:hypothetical protein